MNKRDMFFKEHFWRMLISICGIFLIILTISIGGFLIYKGTDIFTKYGHSLGEFLFSGIFKPNDSQIGANGEVGAAAFIVGSLLTCFLSLLIATPFSLASAIFMTEISPKLGKKIFRPAVEIFVGIPSIVYGWTGLTILVPFIKGLFNLPYGNTIFTASIVLAIMIFPSITGVAADSISSVSDNYKSGAYGLGSTRLQVINKIILPAAAPGIMTGIILGLARAFGEALAVAMVIGKTRAIPKSIFSSASTLTSIIASNMGNTFDGTEYNSALWAMALLLFIISLLLIFLIHYFSTKGEKKANGQDKKSKVM